MTCASTAAPTNEGQTLSISRETVINMLFSLHKRSEVVKANLPPLLCIFQLMLHTFVSLLPTLLVDKGLGLVPDTDEVFHFLHTTIVAVLHLFIDGISAFQAVCPWYTVEP